MFRQELRMGLIGNIIQRRRERESKQKEFEENDRIVNNIERKKLSHNEREIIGIMKKEKEKHFQEALRWEEKRRRGEEMFNERQMFMHGGFNLLE